MNEREIRRTFEVLKGDNALNEVRILNGKKTYSGYFKNVDNLIAELVRYDFGNIYFVFNKIKDECYHREQKERFLPDVKTTKDDDIEGREWILIDIDGRRTTGISSTDLEKSRNTQGSCLSILKGFSEPVSADSGNGYHLLYKVKLKATKENDVLIEKVSFCIGYFRK